MLDSILDRVSYHAVYDASIVDAIRYARENGFSGIQIADETPHMSLARLSRDDLESIATLSNASAVRIGIHGPDEAVSLFQHDEALAAGVRSYYCALFAAAERINAWTQLCWICCSPTWPAASSPCAGTWPRAMWMPSCRLTFPQTCTT